MKLTVLVAVALAGAVAAAPVTVYGPKQNTFPESSAMKDAYVRTYTTADKATKMPVAVGVQLSSALLANALKQPCTSNITEAGKVSCFTDVRATFPTVAGVPQTFGYMILNFGHQGHIPIGVYNVPHFDVHAYLMSGDQLMNELGLKALGPCNGFNRETHFRANKPVPAACFPPGYINVNADAPLQGAHLLPANAPEMRGIKFTNTFVWGMFDGKMNFMEPMITLEYMRNLKAASSDCRAIPMPKEFPKAGYYPTRYCAKKDAQGNVSVEMNTFKMFAAGCKGKPDSGYVIDPRMSTKACPVPVNPNPPKAG